MRNDPMNPKLIPSIRLKFDRMIYHLSLRQKVTTAVSVDRINTDFPKLLGCNSQAVGAPAQIFVRYSLR